MRWLQAKCKESSCIVLRELIFWQSDLMCFELFLIGGAHFLALSNHLTSFAPQ